MISMETKKAALRAAGTKQEPHSPYVPTGRLSTRFTRRIFPGRRDRGLPRPPAGSPTRALSANSRNYGMAGFSLLVVLLALQDCNLPRKDRAPAVAFAERWARQIIDARHLEAA